MPARPGVPVFAGVVVVVVVVEVVELVVVLVELWVADLLFPQPAATTTIKLSAARARIGVCTRGMPGSPGVGGRGVGRTGARLGRRLRFGDRSAPTRPTA